MTKFFCALFALACSFVAHSALAEPLASFRIQQPDPSTLQQISKLFEIEHRDGQSFKVLVPASQMDLLRSLAPTAELLDADTSATINGRLQSYQMQLFGTEDARYHSLAEVQDWLKGIATAHPDFASVIQYGTSQGGRPLMALRLNVDTTAKPVAMITAATHGDEIITTEVLMRLVDKLVGGYGVDERLTQIIKRHDLYFVPVVNVDGFVSRMRYDNGADPNRSYPYPGHENQRPTASIAGVIKLFENIKPVASIDFHAYGEMIMYPWAYTHDPVPSGPKATFHSLTKAMAEKNNYAYGQISDVIYVAPGSSADYYFWKSGSLSLGIEMGQDKAPSPSQFARYVSEQTESTWRFLEAI